MASSLDPTALLALLLPSKPVLFLQFALTTSLALFLTYAFQHLILRPYFSPLYDLPGPPRASIVLGNLKRVFSEEPGKVHDEWAETYGGVVRYGGAYGDTRLMLTDPVALNHILLARSYEYPKPNEVRGNLSRILGKGILFAEGEDHKRQKRIMSPAFAPSHLRDLTPTFFAISYKLRDRWNELVANDEIDAGAWKDEAAAKEYQATKPEGEVVFDVTKWLSRVTLDIIGVAGFGYEFNALDKEENKLAGAFASMMPSPAARPSVYRLLIQQVLGKIITAIPIAKYVPNKTVQAVRKGFETMESESQKIIEVKKQEVAESGGIGGGKDLMTLLLKSNLGESKAVMTDAELQGQMTTFILAGHETTSTALTWTLWTLARNSAIQDRLRKEVRAARAAAKETGRTELGSEELNALEYLDAVTREILRLESPVTATIRSAAKDDLIPLSTPITTPSGRTLSSIPVQAGQVLFISITAINKSSTIFGADANEFRPERWLDGSVGSEEGKSVGVYSHVLTFLAGPRACIGYKFAILELKAILAVLIDDFAFSERSPDLAIERRSAIVMRPLVVGEERLGHRMPLRVRLARRDD